MFKMCTRIELPILVILVVYLIVICSEISSPSTVTGLSNSINAQQRDNRTQISTIFFGCEDHNENLMKCNRLHNKLESFLIKGKSSILYNASDMPMFVPGVENSGLQMYANHLKSITFSNTTTILPRQFSIAFWIKGVSLPDKPNAPTVGHIVSQFNGGHTAGWSFLSVTPYKQNLTKESTRFTVYNTSGDAFSSPDVPIYSNNSFTHIVGTFDGSHVKIYKNGIYFGQTKFNGTFGNKIKIPLTLGVSSSDPMFFYWTGNIDDLRYYDKVISTDEINQIFNNPTIISQSSSGSIIGHWKFNNDLKDISGNKHDGVEHTLISSMVFAPDGRLFFSEKDTGNIRVMKNDKVYPRPFATIQDFHSNWEQGLLGLAIDPDFKNNHFLYQYYTTYDKDSHKPYNRIVRFTDIDNHGSNETIIVDKIPASNGLHSGGAISFGPDNNMYVTIGDATKNIKCGNLPNSTGDTCPAQDPTSLLGKVLRISKDGSIPIDNPYPHSPVYNIGHRNMYGIAFDKTGLGLVSENGADLFDEINTVEKGKNYGSPTIQPADSDPELSSNYTRPLRSYYNSYCLTQMIYYDGDKISRFKDKFLVAALSGSNTIYALEVDRINKEIVREEALFLDNFLNNEVVALAQSPSGDIYYGAYAISKLDPSITNNSNRTQFLFPIKIEYSPHIIGIDRLFFDNSKKEIKVDIDSVIDNVNYIDRYHVTKFTVAHNSTLKIIIPKGLLNEIKSVTAAEIKTNGQNGAYQNLSYTVNGPIPSDYSELEVSPPRTGNFTLRIG